MTFDTLDGLRAWRVIQIHLFWGQKLLINFMTKSILPFLSCSSYDASIHRCQLEVLKTHENWSWHFNILLVFFRNQLLSILNFFQNQWLFSFQSLLLIEQIFVTIESHDISVDLLKKGARSDYGLTRSNHRLLLDLLFFIGIRYLDLLAFSFVLFFKYLNSNISALNDFLKFAFLFYLDI